ncbi:hypothetical protein [Pontibacter oryzae]|uniref:hypothetical protein n=1 Tax=Pontibacter oryzae TaxID=2304593 RepID=UPI0013154A0F|nr:hypothetical protein [Pontibacter oryzae]
MKGKLTKRDVLFFLIGIITFFLIDFVRNWEGHKKAFKEGYNQGYKSYSKAEKQE